MFLFKYIFQQLNYLLKNKDGRNFLSLLLKYGDRKRNTKNKIRLFNHPFTYLDNWSFLFQYKEIFVDEFYFFNTKSESPLIIDCGSNIGLSCIYFSKKYPNATIIGFEPNPEVFKVLKENTAYIKENLSLKEEAVWINDNGIDFHFNEADSGSVIGGKNHVKVKSMRLKTFIEKFESVDFLKVDIEGAETDVILDCDLSLKKCNNIFIEFHSYKNGNQKLGEILEILEKNNFRYYIHNNSKINKPFGEIKLPENGMDLQVNIFAKQN